MSPDRLDRLVDLLPLDLRREDREASHRLEPLLRLIAASVNEVEDDLQQLYDDLFIETAADWVVPYIAALVANDVIWDPSLTADAVTATVLFPEIAGRDLRAPIGPQGRSRADVARTISYRRRKGTIAVIEELARNVSGWPVRAVEAFQHLGWNQHVNHLRPAAVLADLRVPEVAERVGSAFEATMHTVDVRPTNRSQGRYNICNVVLHTWRLLAYPLVHVAAAQAPGVAFGWTFSPLGNPTPLFSRARREGDRARQASELQVPQPIRRTLFAADLAAYAASSPRRAHTELYGEFEPVAGSGLDEAPDASLVVYCNGAGVSPAADPTAPPAVFTPTVICRRLDPWPAAAPAGPVVHVDVVAGRLVVGAGFAQAVDDVHVSYHVGATSTLGGGGYPRPAWLLPDGLGLVHYWVARRPGVVAPGTPAPALHPTVVAAMAAWASDGRPAAVVHVLDSDTYELPGSFTLPNDGSLTIEAAGGQRPLLLTAPLGLRVNVNVPLGAPDRNAELTLSGVVVQGHVRVEGALRRFRLWHTTLVPGRALDVEGAPVHSGPSLRVSSGALGTDADRLRIEVAFSILGAIACPDGADGIWLLDSVLDAADPARHAVQGLAAGAAGPPLYAERSTVSGRLLVASLDASSCIFVGDVDVRRTQEGCVRFSFVRPGSVTGRRFRCQPELAVRTLRRKAVEADPTVTAAALAALQAGAEARIVPRFTDLRYGRPAYPQLHDACPPEIALGADDGAEMGALNHVKQMQREANVAARVAEYLPFGLDAAIVHET